MIFLIIACIYDVWTTLEVLKRGGKELNPIVKKLMDRFGEKEALIGSKIVLVGAFALLQPPEWVFWLVAGLTFAVAVNNHRILRKM